MRSETGASWLPSAILNHKVHIHLPPTCYFRWPYDTDPLTLPAPSASDSFASWFSVDPVWYNRLLNWRVPVVSATLYILTALVFNAYNLRRGNKPWRISGTKPFLFFVLAHNVMLALYSLVTFTAMFGAIRRTWPGLRTEHGLAGAVDAMCKLHGPRGLGDAAIWNRTENSWVVRNHRIHLGSDGSPDPTDVGRLWNEGLALFGWLFYLSKFYEVIDTFILLAKGKRISTLQTYHHAGAMLCVWAGIRFMSPPIWMFVLANSGIHALMYTYYTLTTLGIRVPRSAKRMLTTMQISQFLVGATYAFLHLFISYEMPVSRPYSVTTTITSVASVVSSAAATAIRSAASAASSAAISGGLAGFLKKLAYRAAGEEGLAENVGEVYGPKLPFEARSGFETISETRYREDWERVTCLDTPGQAFAIYANVIYLVPLTVMFIQFFIRSYVHRSASKAKHPTEHGKVSKSAHDAVKGVERGIEQLGKRVEDHIGKLPEQAKALVENGHVQDKIENVEHRLKAAKDWTADTVTANGHAVADAVVSKGHATADAVTAKGHAVAHAATSNGRAVADVVTSKGRAAADSVTAKGRAVANAATSNGRAIADTVAASGRAVLDTVTEKGRAVVDTATDTTEEAVRKVAGLLDAAEKKIDVQLNRAKEVGADAVERANEITSGPTDSGDVNAVNAGTPSEGDVGGVENVISREQPVHVDNKNDTSVSEVNEEHDSGSNPDRTTDNDSQDSVAEAEQDDGDGDNSYDRLADSEDLAAMEASTDILQRPNS